MTRRPPRSPLFPYTTLFRSEPHALATHLELATLGAGFFAVEGEPRLAERWANAAYHGSTDAIMPDGSRGEAWMRSEEHTSELQSHVNLVCRLLLEKKKINIKRWVLNQATEQSAAWACRTGRPVDLAVNVSPPRLADDDIVAVASQARHANALPAPP